MVAIPARTNFSRSLSLPDLRQLTALVRVALADYYQRRVSLPRDQQELVREVYQQLHHAEFETLLSKIGYPAPLYFQALWLYHVARQGLETTALRCELPR